ncbi:MAG: hypothetical protein RSF42_00630 [Comamonas sp.]
MSMRTWVSSAFAAVAMAFAAPSFAARDFTPQAGTWVASSELGGNPGRGLAIDVQGNTFFMQVFGYEKNGEATFYTATAQMEGNHVTAPLIRYKGGHSFGSAARDAMEDQAVGDVMVSFRNGLKGVLQFPDEQAVAIERFLVLSTEPGVTNPRMQLGIRTVQLLVQDAQGAIAYDWRAEVTRTEANSVKLMLKQLAYPESAAIFYSDF